MQDIIQYKLMLDDARNAVVVKDHSYSYRYDSLTSSGEVASMLNHLFQLDRQAEEYMYMLCFDAKMHPLGIFEISHGCFDETFAGVREIFSKALLLCATNIIIAHNHPTGHCEMSVDDSKVLKRLKEASNVLGVGLSDFLIIGDDSHFSARKSGLLD